MLKKINKNSSFFPNSNFWPQGGFTRPNFLKKNLGGFTLIEVLVVIAIIGILAGIILIAMGEVRKKAKDSRIISEMGQFRNAATLYYHTQNPNTYTGMDCSIIVPNIKALCDDIGLQGGTLTTVVASQEYCVEVQLNNGKWWCIDSRGRSERYDAGTTPTEPVCDDTPGSEVYTCE